MVLRYEDLMFPNLVRHAKMESARVVPLLECWGEASSEYMHLKTHLFDTVITYSCARSCLLFLQAWK